MLACFIGEPAFLLLSRYGGNPCVLNVPSSLTEVCMTRSAEAVYIRRFTNTNHLLMLTGFIGHDSQPKRLFYECLRRQ